MLNEREAKRAGAQAGKSAASWLEIGSKRDAERLLEMLDDGDPELDDYLPRRPDLSGEWAGESINEILQVDDDDDDEDIDRIADIWQEAADEAFDKEIERQIRYHAE